MTFTKVAGRRYTISLARRTGPALATRYAPGYDDYLPHDAVHFLAEAEAGLRGGPRHSPRTRTTQPRRR